jgi:hypothetical protein
VVRAVAGSWAYLGPGAGRDEADNEAQLFFRPARSISIITLTHRVVARRFGSTSRRAMERAEARCVRGSAQGADARALGLLRIA